MAETQESGDVHPDASPRDHGVLIVSAGMESAGSGWLFNMTNELLQAAGQEDVRKVKERYDLEDVLRWDNCNIRDLDTDVWARIEPVVGEGHTFVVKSHRAPSDLAAELMASGRLRATYVHRDPRDVVVSAVQRGKKRRERERTDSFARLRSMYHGIAWMRLRQLPVYEAWRRQPGAMVVRYEDLRGDTPTVLRRVADHLAIEVTDEQIEAVAAAYTGEKSRQQVGAHFRGGGRRRDEMNRVQTWLCSIAFRGSLRRMGYEA